MINIMSDLEIGRFINDFTQHNADCDLCFLPELS